MCCRRRCREQQPGVDRALGVRPALVRRRPHPRVHPAHMIVPAPARNRAEERARVVRTDRIAVNRDHDERRVVLLVLRAATAAQRVHRRGVVQRHLERGVPACVRVCERRHVLGRQVHAVEGGGARGRCELAVGGERGRPGERAALAAVREARALHGWDGRRQQGCIRRR